MDIPPHIRRMTALASVAYVVARELEEIAIENTERDLHEATYRVVSAATDLSRDLRAIRESIESAGAP